jgi:hypothetical protein
MGATSHTGVWITKDASGELICHGMSWLLWRRWCCKGGILLSKITTKLRVKPHVRSADIGSKVMRGIKVLIVGIYLLEWSRRVALSFLKAQREMSPVWVKSELDLLHILLELLTGFSFFMQPCFYGMVGATHTK